MKPRTTPLANWLSPVPTLAALIVTIAACLLGNWQLNRGHEKRERAARLEQLAQAPALEVTRQEIPLERATYHRVKVRGTFDASRTILLDNRPHSGAGVARVGFHVLTPLRIAGAVGSAGSGPVEYVLVNRGWLPRDPQERTRIAPFPTPAGEIEVSGTAVATAGRVFELGSGNEAGQVIRQNADVAALAVELGTTLQPFVLQQTSDTGDGLARDWPKADSGAERHDGYAFQWFALAALTIVFWGASVYRRVRRAEIRTE